MKKSVDIKQEKSQSKKEIINDLFTKPNQGSTKQSRIIVITVVLSVLAGVISGLIGVVLVLSGSLENSPFFRAFSLETILPERQVIIRQQQEVTVAQDKLLGSLLVKLDPAIITFVRSKKPDKLLGSIYTSADILGHGLVLTADGWLAVLDEVISDQSAGKIRIITSNGTIYSVEDIVKDKTSSVSFVKIKANNLIAAPIAEDYRFKTGESLVSLSRNLPSGQIAANKINVKNLDETEIIQSSEELRRQVIITMNGQPVAAPVFNLAGELVGLQSKNGKNGIYKLKPVYHFISILPEVLDGTDLKRAYLGIDWINLHGNTGISDKLSHGLNKGAFVQDFNLDSPALVAGLEIGDIIRKINDVELNGSLDFSEQIQKFNPGEKIFLNVLRGQKELEFDLNLGAF